MGYTPINAIFVGSPEKCRLQTAYRQSCNQGYAGTALDVSAHLTAGGDRIHLEPPH